MTTTNGTGGPAKAARSKPPTDEINVVARIVDATPADVKVRVPHSVPRAGWNFSPPDDAEWERRVQELIRIRGENRMFVAQGRPQHCLSEPDWASECEALLEARSRPIMRSVLLRDLLLDTERMRPPKMLVADLVRQNGTSLFFGREKRGKTTVVSQMAASLTTGGTFLGEALSPAFVLWIAADEPLPDTATRLQRYGADTAKVSVVDGRIGARELAQELQAVRGVATTLPVVVVVDTLGELLSPMIANENDSAPMLKAMRPYIDAIRVAGAACIFIHHSNKSGSDFRGSGAIGGAVDCLVHFRERYPASRDPNVAPVETDDVVDTRRVLDIKSRWSTVKKHLQFDGALYALGDAPASLPLRIEMQLRQHGAISGSRLAEALGAKKQSVLDELKRLESAGVVTRSGAGTHPVYLDATMSGTGGGTDAGLCAPNDGNRTGTAPIPEQRETGTGAEPELTQPIIASVPELTSQRVAREPIDDDGWMRALLDAGPPSDESEYDWIPE